MLALILTAFAMATQTPAAPLDVDIPQVANVTQDPTCGGREALATQAFCLMTTQVAAESVVTTFTEAFQAQGWIAADGRDNLVIYVKRKPEGGCTAFQMVAFADDRRPAAPGSPAYLALASIPGDICRSQGGATAPQ